MFISFNKKAGDAHPYLKMIMGKISNTESLSYSGFSFDLCEYSWEKDFQNQ